MSIRTLLIPLLTLCLLQGACVDEKQQAKTNDIVVLDLGRIIRDSEPGKSAQDFMSQIQQAFNKQLTAASEKAGKDNPESFQKLELMYTTLQQRFQQEEQAATNTLIESILKTVGEVRTQNGYKVIVRSEASLSTDPACDITDKVMDAVNKTRLDFKPVTGDPNTIELPSAPEQAPVKESAAEQVPAEAPAAETAPAAEPAPAEAPAAEPAPAEAPAAEPAPAAK